MNTLDWNGSTSEYRSILAIQRSCKDTNPLPLQGVKIDIESTAITCYSLNERIFSSQIRKSFQTIRFERSIRKLDFSAEMNVRVTISISGMNNEKSSGEAESWRERERERLSGVNRAPAYGELTRRARVR